jgi:predicted alpha/beta hydrolase
MKTAVGVLNKWFGYFPGKRIGLPSDMPGGVVHQWANWCNNPNGLFDTFPDNNYRKLQVPLLAFSFSDDWHCPPQAVQELLNRFANAVTTWHHIRPAEIGVKKIGHTGFFDQRMRTTLWLQLLHWLNKEDRKEKPAMIPDY